MVVEAGLLECLSTIVCDGNNLSGVVIGVRS